MPPFRRQVLHQCLNFRPNSASQTIGLSRAVFKKDSLEQVYDWIRKDDPGVVIPPSETLGLFFPDGPYDESTGEVGIVAVTPERVSQSFHELG